MPKICIQAGHQNCKNNSIVSLRSSTGAPNEMEFNVDIRDRVSDELRKRGFDVQGTDANANDDHNITSQDWDLFLAIHYDADVYGKGGGFADYPEPSTDKATQESQRIKKIFDDIYFSKTEIVNIPGHSNGNTRFYYMWKYLSAKTPCVILECGVGMHVPDDWQKLHFNRPLVIEAITRAVCKAFNVRYELNEETQPPNEVETICIPKKQFDELQKSHNEAAKRLSELEAIIDEFKSKAGQSAQEIKKVISSLKNLQ